MYLFTPVIDCFLIWTLLSSFLDKNSEVSHRNVGGILLLLLKEMSHIIAENFKNQNFVSGVEWS